MKVTLFTIPTARIALTLVALWMPLQAQAETRAEIVQKKAAENPKAKWHELMDTGPFISDTFLAFGQEGPVSVLKGIAIKVGDKEQASVVFDTELVRMVAGFDGQVTLAGTPWDGKHGGNSYLPEDPGAYYFATNRTPGWSVDGKWEDPRKDSNGPLPDEHAEYLGVYQHGAEVVLSYTVSGTPVLEMPSYDSGALIRSFEVGEVTKDLQILLSEPVETASELKEVAPNLVSETDGLEIKTLEDGKVVLPIPAGTKSARFQVIYADPMLDVSSFAVPELKPLTKGGPALFPETIALNGILGQGEGSYISDSIPLPKDNPWMSEIRFGAFDFFSDGNRVACSTWNGDVWIAEGIGGDLETITWRRFASGLYQTLGLKIVDDVVYTQGRDQLTRLHDLNNDGEADFYECFNNDVLITEGFHEFSFDLQTDKEGNFYFSKAMPVLAGGRGFAHHTPHNGAILKVSPDGKKLERVAWGIRAPGGIGVGPEGQLTTGENEGSYVPRCKITWSDPKGGSFHGVIPSEWDGKEFVSVLPGQPSEYEKPLCWLPYYVDNSSGSQFWVPEDSEWELHRGEMIHLSYGKSSVYRVLREVVNGQIQGGVYRLPIDLTTASMRGRFHPKTGNLYIIGFRGWQTNGGTGFQRVRYQGETTPVPLELNAHENGLIVQFSNKLDPEVAEDPRRYSISKWKYIWGPMYGSGRFSIDNPDFDAENLALKEPSKGSQNQIDSVPVRAAKLLGEGDKLFLYIPGMTPAMQMEVKMDLAAADGTSFRETIWNTIHNLRPGFEDHGLDLDNLPEIDTAPIGAPGLILSMAHGSTDDATVVDRLAITLGEKTPATPFIDPRRGKEMVFEGNLVVETRDDLAFRLDGIGWASLKINGEVVAEGDLPLTSEPVTLDAGPHAIFCSFRRQDKGEGRLQLLWSGTDFIWEPVRPSAFRHLSNAVLEAKDKIRDGRDLFAAIRCIECHTPNKKFAADLAMPEIMETLPDFANAGHRLNQGWVESWVRKPQDFCPSVAPDEAADIAAYLASLKSEEIPITRGELKAGEELAKKLHLTFWTDQLKESAKHTAGGLQQFLADPALHHPDTTFPNVRLTAEEAAHIAAWVQSNQPPVPATAEGVPAHGEAVYMKRCAVCHTDDQKATYEFPAMVLEDMWEQDWLQHGCLSEEEGNAPELGLSLDQKQALLAFKNADSNAGLKSLFVTAPNEYATRTMERLNCVQCHSGENTLPDISLAGEKLRTDWLASLFHGDAAKIRPWEEARMPAFASRSEPLSVGLASRAGVTIEDSNPDLEAAKVPMGEQISGLMGYACVTCHAVGSQPALQAFEGQGPNLELAGDRLRYDFYQSWMHWPQRFVPLTIMPKYTTDKDSALLPQFLEGDASDQFEAVWQWMQTLEGAE